MRRRSYLGSMASMIRENMRPDTALEIHHRILRNRAAEQAIREREEKYPELTHAQEAINWQTKRITEIYSEYLTQELEERA